MRAYSQRHLLVHQFGLSTIKTTSIKMSPDCLMHDVFAKSHLWFPLDGVERAPENKLDLLLHLVREMLHGAEVLAQKLPENKELIVQYLSQKLIPT